MQQYSKEIKERVRSLRRKGFSLGQIYKETVIPKTTIRTWISDIKLSKGQLEVLRQRTQIALQKGRVRSQKERKSSRERKEKRLVHEGKEYLDSLSSRELFIAGVALYWAEGFKNKHERRLGFCNSDPTMIQFYMRWLEKSLGIKRDLIVARLTLNYVYKDKIEEMQYYWSDIIGIPLAQFTKPFYQSSKWKKQYNTNNYHGVLRVHVKNSIDHVLKMRGWIEALKFARIANKPG